MLLAHQGFRRGPTTARPPASARRASWLTGDSKVVSCVVAILGSGSTAEGVAQMKKRRYWQILGLLVIAGIAMLAAAHAGKTPRLAAEVAMQARLHTAARRSS